MLNLEIIDVPNSSDGWLIGNLKHSGFYRVNYDQENWNRIINQLIQNHNEINSINRAQILDDTFNLGKAEYVEQIVFLEISKYLNNEIDPLPFSAAFNGLNYINDMIESSNFSVYKSYQVILN